MSRIFKKQLRKIPFVAASTLLLVACHSSASPSTTATSGDKPATSTSTS